MKFKNISWIMLLPIVLLSSCIKDKCVYESFQYIYEPVILTWDEIDTQIGTEAARGIESPGKIFLLGDFLFINEVNKGIHVIDNSVPSNPINKYFINIPGSLDIAALGNQLYSDNYSDLITIDISDLENTKLVDRVPNVFNSNSTGFGFIRTDEGITTDWIQKDTVIEYDCGYYGYQEPFFDDVFTLETSNGDMLLGSNTSGDAIGVAGSMARFALQNSNLYVLDNSNIKVFERGISLTELASQYIDWGIETIFPYEDYLFIGANSGMYIMDISDPIAPVLVSSYQHMTSCDPVVVRGDYAYVTLRSGTNCQNFTNQLDVIDISSIETPNLLVSHQLVNPHGLGIANDDVLFICDGDSGLKIYNAEDKFNLDLIKHYNNINAYDVIPFHNSLFMIGSDGFYQYDYSNLNDITLISKIPVLN